MKLIKGLLFIVLLTAAIILPFYFEILLRIFIELTPFGWVSSSVIIRLIVIILFIYALKNFFALFSRTKKLKMKWVVLIALTPGFLISFAIHPIYTVDYGLQNDGVKLSILDQLQDATEGETYERTKEFNLIAFLTTHCSYCENACQKLGTNLKNGQKLKIDLVFGDSPTEIDAFINENKGELFNKHIIPFDGKFIDFSGIEFPSIFLVNPEGETVYHWIGDEMNYSALDYLGSLEL